MLDYGTATVTQRDSSTRRIHGMRRRQGLTLVEVLVATTMLAVVGAIAIPNLLAARKGANEAAAIGALKTLGSAQTLYHTTTGQYAGSFQNLIDAGSLSAAFFPTTLGTRSGYLFSLCTDPCGAVPGPGSAYKTLAVPASAGTGNRVFSEDDTGRILATVGTVPTPADQVVEPGSGTTSTCQTGCIAPGIPPQPSQAELDAFSPLWTCAST